MDASDIVWALAFGVMIALAICAFAFWIAMLLQCAYKEPTMGNDKLLWLIVILFLHLPGALLYFFFRRPQRIALYGK